MEARSTILLEIGKDLVIVTLKLILVVVGLFSPFILLYI
jgi:hypothetical protein